MEKVTWRDYQGKVEPIKDINMKRLWEDMASLENEKRDMESTLGREITTLENNVTLQAIAINPGLSYASAWVLHE